MFSNRVCCVLKRLGKVSLCSLSQWPKNLNNLKGVNQCCKPNFSVSARLLVIESQVNERTEEEAEEEELTGGDPDRIRLLKLVKLEVEVARQDGDMVPDKITKREWKELLDTPSKLQRSRYLVFLFKNEKSGENLKLKKKLASEARLKKLDEEAQNNNHIRYGLAGNTIFFRLYDKTMDQQLNNKLVQAMQFSQDIVVDCSYEKHMSKREVKNCAKQMCLMFASNRSHIEPYNIRFCNVDKSGLLMEQFHRYIPTCYDESFPLNLHTESYLDIYPKEKLVYLTPHGREVITDYSHDDVYVIGAMVDTGASEPLSLAKAKEQGIRYGKLPFDKFLLWGHGHKNLTLNAVINIMLDMRKYNDWSRALNHVPKRKLVHNEETLLKNPNFVRKQETLTRKFTGPFTKKKIPIKSLFDE